MPSRRWRPMNDGFSVYPRAGVVSMPAQPLKQNPPGANRRAVFSFDVICGIAAFRTALMPRGHYVLKSLPCGILVPVLAGDIEPALACCTVPGAVLLGVDIEQGRKITGAVL